MAGELLLDRPADGVLRLTISNPAKRNALDHAILDAIAAVLGDLGDARACSSPGAGGMFSSGYDIGDIPEDVFAEEAERLVAHPFAAALDALDDCPIPTVAALPGHTIGGGLELALACDLRLAADGILLGMPPAKLGLVYSHTGLRRFMQAIGAPRTRELFLTGRNVDARTALSWGLVNEVVGSADLESAAVDLAAGPRRQRAAERARQQARDPRAAGRRGPARPERRARADRAARGVLPLRGHARGRARVRPEAPGALEGPLTAAATRARGVLSAAAARTASRMASTSSLFST